MVADLAMPPRVERTLRQAAHDLAGIHLGPEKHALIASRVHRRMRALGLGSYGAYLEHFESHPGEAQHFVNAITTNTTYFFREASHFQVVVDHVRQQVERGQRRLRLWCAAASTGQEPYTLAMALLHGLGGASVDLMILATDIDTRVLHQARRGVYGRDELGKVPAVYRPYFEPHAGGMRVTEEVRRRVRFARLNLTDAPYPMKGPLDVVLCRNVMIYFDEPTRRRLVHEIQRLLGPEGLLCIGHSETLHGLGHGLTAVRPSVFRKGAA